MSKPRRQKPVRPEALATRLQGRTATWILGILICLFFVVTAHHRAAPFVDDVNETISAGDDWLLYKTNAVDIVHGGWTIPDLKEPYFQPGGFLYCHFVALIFKLSGINTTYVYFVQMALAGLAVMCFYLAFRHSLAPALSLWFLSGLVLVLYYDLVVQWGRYLLSENLAVVFLSFGVLALRRAFRSGGAVRFAGAGAVFGLVILTRQSLVAVPLGIAVVIAWAAGLTRQSLGRAAAFLSGSAALFLALPIRNAVVTGSFALSPRYASHLPEAVHLGPMLKSWLSRSLYCVGVLTSDARPLQVTAVNTPWLVICVVAAIAVVWSIRRQELEPMEASAVAFLVCAFVPFIVLPRLGAYGMRFQLPYAALMLFLAFRLIHRVTTFRSGEIAS